MTTLNDLLRFSPAFQNRDWRDMLPSRLHNALPRAMNADQASQGRPQSPREPLDRLLILGNIVGEKRSAQEIEVSNHRSSRVQHQTALTVHRHRDLISHLAVDIQ